jgi:transposase
VYLPPYSPDLSPIENIWSKVKQSLRTSAARIIPALGNAITAAFAAVTTTDCHGCFEACGYTLHLK